jgi:hypothetical protein
MNRREFIKKSAVSAACAVSGFTFPLLFTSMSVAVQAGDLNEMDDLFQAILASNVGESSKLFSKKLTQGDDAWKIHLSLFPVAQRILNPPYINPHLPKMHAIYREFTPYLNEKEIAALIHIEVVECAKRPKLDKLSKAKLPQSPVSFKDVESAIGEQDWEKTTGMMTAFHDQRGREELTRRLLLLGSGHLDRSLGHSISCTAFILLELLERSDQDLWTALAPLAYYFCRGRFHRTPTLRKSLAPYSGETLPPQVLQAASGHGIVNLHHTITIYAIERVRHFFSTEEYFHLISSWTEFMGRKEARPIKLDIGEIKPASDYDRFYNAFSRLNAEPVVASLKGLITSPEGRKQIKQYLIRGVCDLYQGNYNAHNMTGLGSALWVVDQFWRQPSIVETALSQYIDFFFDDLKSKN